MVSEADLMKECCGFFELPFSKQLELNEAMLKEHLQRWMQTDQAKALCPKGFESIDAIPVTTYDDYPAMLQLKSNIERLEKMSPRMPGEVMWDYYDRIGRAAAKPISNYIIGDFSFVAKTSGTVGEPKWVVHGIQFWENFRKDVIATTLLACSDSWGSTKFRIGDKGLNFTPSAPFLSGWGRKASQGIVIDVPPIGLMDNINDARRRFFIALEYLEKGNSVNLAGGVAPSVYIMCEYFSNPEDLFREYYDSMEIGPAKLYLFQKWIQSKISRRSRNVKDFLKLKGLMIGGVDTNLYYEYLRTKLGVEPYCIYGVTELGLPMFGSPDKKHKLLPNLRSCYIEFVDEAGEVKKITELKRGNIYSVIATPFGSSFIRYDVSDMFRVVDIRDDGMPIFSFWGRKNSMLIINKLPPYVYLTEALAVEIMARAGLSLSDKWAFTKTLEGDQEKLLLLMENTWGLTEHEAEKRIFEVLINLSPDLKNLVKVLDIKEPSDLIKVEYIKKGAFFRYSIKRAKEGHPMGQIKPPKIIPSERQELCEALRGA
jgi:phenylacetate-coenzyme A ligase PaaK-like adenylate-forming protein